MVWYNCKILQIKDNLMEGITKDVNIEVLQLSQRLTESLEIEMV